MTETAHLTHNGSLKLLVRGCRYVYPGEVYECSVEEATTRMTQDPGLWNREEAPAVDDTPPATETKDDVTPAKDDATPAKVEVTPAKEKLTPVKKKTPEKKVGDKIQK